VPLPRFARKIVRGLIERANYTVVRTDLLQGERRAVDMKLRRLEATLESERQAADMNLRRLQASGLFLPPQDSRSEPKGGPTRPLNRITSDADFADDPAINKEWIDKLLASERFAAIESEFRGYPPSSFVSDTQRAFLFCLVRVMEPQAVAEIGTAFCGTSEIIARALWENGTGILHTTDPFGAERAPPIIRKWLQPLQDVTRFYPLSSMDFFVMLYDTKAVLDIAFIDGNHDFEFAYFDVLMAARLLRPGGILVIDNTNQTGPYYAAAQFLNDNPDWVELGDAMTRQRSSQPFSVPRSSLPNSDCLVLKAPDAYPIGRIPRTTGQLETGPRITGFSLNIETRKFCGLLHYRFILRAFRSGNREIEEYKRAGKITLDSATIGHVLNHHLDPPLVSLMHERHGDCLHKVEIELAWEGSETPGTLQLSAPPIPIVGENSRQN
jgi:predicted O-methyltransferase YrrM